jgi:hypothetical protein
LVFGVNQALNFFDFGTFSPLSILSAPIFFPSLGQPYLGAQAINKDKIRDPNAALYNIFFITVISDTGDGKNVQKIIYNQGFSLNQLL